MSRFRPSASRSVPGINTASLPDMIFTLLFFFVIVTNMRTVPVMTQFNLPVAEELQKLEEKSLIVYIMVGKDASIQLNSDFVSLEEIPARLEKLKNDIPEEDRGKLIVVLKVDKDMAMGTVNDIKQYLRRAGILTIHYSAEKSRSK
ncbi:MAG: biopolymer transporter ExbD [Dysgonamonadaceae bacterium]|jgi:biopolymer transport protein ExbD|nr:biopolymer transporter ExbD [Dysgonamonadaceae bacterium]